ncbi:MAG: hypothetical protein ACLQBB_07800 [Solirubrobacteraceae bacterium]
MSDEAAAGSQEQDWRLKVELRSPEAHRSLRSVLDRVREPDVAEEAKTAVGDEVVITHDGNHLFAYASDRARIDAARAAIESVLARDGVSASFALTRWSGEVDEWVDPDRSEAESAAARRDAAEVGTRTYVATLGKWVREEFEQSMRAYADRLGLECEIVEHPHLLNTQAAFTVTGPSRKLDEFAAAMKAEEGATIRTETAVMISPL